MRKVNPELWLPLFLVATAAMLNFLVASQPMTLMFYFLPTLYSAYRFGRRHTTLTAIASVVLVVLLTYVNPTALVRPVNLPIDSRWFDLTIWGGILVVSSYAMGTLYERNEKNLHEVRNGPGRRLSPEEAQETIIKNSADKYDSMIVDAFRKAFGRQAKAATV
jgi:small neutral amino acid transporter SnatA (MarC family)